MSSKLSFANTGSLQSVLWTASQPESEAAEPDSPSALVVPTSLHLRHSPEQSLSRETGDSSEPPPQLVTGEKRSRKCILSSSPLSVQVFVTSIKQTLHLVPQIARRRNPLSQSIVRLVIFLYANYALIMRSS